MFWKSSQTKVEGLAVDLVEGSFQLGWPRLSESAVDLFREEYRLPSLSPELGAMFAALGEHLLPVLILADPASRIGPEYGAKPERDCRVDRRGAEMTL